MENSVRLLVIGHERLYLEIQEAVKGMGDGTRFTIRPERSLRQGVEVAKNIAPEIVFFEMTDDLEEMKTVAREIKAVSPQSILVGTFMTGPGQTELDSLIVIEGMRAGVKDFLHRPISSRDLKQLLNRVSDDNLSQSKIKTGKIITIVSNKGGVGKSTMAVNIACELAHRYPEEVLLVDTSVQLGTLVDMLDLKLENSIFDAIRQIGRLDETLLRKLVIKHESGLDLLAAPSNAEEANELTEEYLARILNLARKSYKFVIVDTFPMIDSLVIAALDYSDLIYIVTEGVVPIVLGTAKLIELMDELEYPLEKQRIILNRYSAFAGNITPEYVEERIQREVDYVVPYSRHSLIAMNLGKPLVQMMRMSKPYNRFVQVIVDILIKMRIQLPLIARKNSQIQFVYELGRIVEEIDVLNRESSKEQKVMVPSKEEKYV